MMHKTMRIEELKQRIAELQEEVRMIEKWVSLVRPLNSFTSEEKAEIFDKLYEWTSNYLAYFIDNGREPINAEHCIYEIVLEEVLGKNVWDIINSI